MKKHSDSTVRQFARDLAARRATPGGGSASAAAAAIGVSLLIMAAKFGIGSHRAKKTEKEIEKMLGELAKSRMILLGLIDKDAESFGLVCRAMKLPKVSAQAAEFRRKRIQAALKKSLSVPVRVFEVSSGTLPAAERLLAIGNRNLESDVYCAVSLIRSGMETAKFNMDANLKYISDSGFRAKFFKKYRARVGKSLSRAGSIIKNHESENH